MHSPSQPDKTFPALGEFLDGFYHADPHTGNIFVGSGGDVLYFIDVGSVSQISLKNSYLLYQLMKALASQDGKKVLKVINKMAGQNMPDLTQSANDIAASKENVVKKIIIVFKALEDAHVTVDKELISIFRCFGQGEILFRAALLSEEKPSSGTETGTKSSSPIDRGFEGDVGLKRNEAERRAEHQGESQQAENGNKAPEDLSRNNAGKVVTPVDQRSGASESAKAQLQKTGADKRGGIDFTVLPKITPPVTMSAVNLNSMPMNRLNDVNLDSEWIQIQNMVNAGIIPSEERFKEYILACCQKRDLGSRMDKILGCFAAIMSLQKERVIDTGAELKDMIVLIETGKSENELQASLAQITIAPLRIVKYNPIRTIKKQST